jgi:competence ComEA-like helix-hairpin-helix protein
MREFLKGWFSYSRAERNGITVLIILLLSAIGYRYYVSHYYQPLPIMVSTQTKVDATAFKQDIAKWEKDTILDINMATTEQLTQLNGIGPTLAQRIVDYREQIGGYNNIEQVNDVKGIGDKKMAAIRPYIKVVNSSRAKKVAK